MRNAALAQVGENQHDHQHGENQAFDEFQRQAVAPEFQHESHGGQNFNDGIDHGNVPAAITATPVQKDVTEHRNVVMPADTVTAAGAARSGADHRFALWNPHDADVEKAPENQSEQGHYRLDHSHTHVQQEAATVPAYCASSKHR